MDDSFIIAAYSVIAETLEELGHYSHPLATVSDPEVLTVAVVAAKYFQNHQERALSVMIGSGHVPRLSVSRYNRRLHTLAAWLEGLLGLLSELFNRGEVFIIDSLPVPVCRRVRARRCKKVSGKAFCGYCAAKKEKFFGQVSIADVGRYTLNLWRLHLVCTPTGVPVSFALLEASHQHRGQCPGPLGPAI